MPFEEINGLKIYYEDRGQGEPIILMHHGFGCTQMWKEIYPALVENDFRVIMYDRRGYGRSEKGEDFEEFYVSDRFCPQNVDELNKLLDALGIGSFHIVAQCEGGVIGVQYAVTFPERVKSLTTSSTQCYSEISMPEFNKIKFTKPFKGLDDEMKQKLIEWHGEERAEPFFNMFRDRGGAYGTGFFDLRRWLPLVQCPALVLYPDRSFLFDVEQAVAFYRHLPDGELAVLPRCGHNTYEHQPVEYIRNVLNFLDRHMG